MNKPVKRKATLVLMNSVGFVIIRHVYLCEHYLKPTYQGSFKKNMVVKFIPKGCRNVVGYGYEQIAIYEGWQGVTDSPIEGFCFDSAKFEATKKDFKDLIVEYNASPNRSLIFSFLGGNFYAEIALKIFSL